MKKLEDCRSAYDDALKKYNKQNNVEKRAKVGCIDFGFYFDFQHCILFFIDGLNRTSL